jgi:hypothetical protein
LRQGPHGEYSCSRLLWFCGTRAQQRQPRAEGEEFVERRENLFLLLGLSRDGFQASSAGLDLVKPIAASRSLDLVGSLGQLVPVPALGLSVEGVDPVRHFLHEEVNKPRSVSEARGE